MRKTTSILLAVLLLCGSLMTGCTQTAEQTTEESSSSSVSATEETGTQDVQEEKEETEESSDEETSDTEEAAQDVIGTVTAVEEGSVTLTVYTAADGEAITDYTRVDLDVLDTDGTAYTVEISDETVYYTTEPDTYLPADAASVAVGEMIAVTAGTDGAQWIIVLTDMQDEEEADDTETEESETEETEEASTEEDTADAEESADEA